MNIKQALAQLEAAAAFGAEAARAIKRIHDAAPGALTITAALRPEMRDAIGHAVDVARKIRAAKP